MRASKNKKIQIRLGWNEDTKQETITLQGKEKIARASVRTSEGILPAIEKMLKRNSLTLGDIAQASSKKGGGLSRQGLRALIASMLNLMK